MTTSICFICLGNICRSPLAEGIARHLANENHLELNIESAGTGGWHIGEPPDSRMIATAAHYGIDISRQRAQQVQGNFDTRFDLLICMDDSNVRNTRQIVGPAARIVKLLDYTDAPESDVPDPYYGGDEGFERVYTLVYSGVAGLLKSIT